MNVVLIAPPNPSMIDPRIAPPLGLLYLAAAQYQRFSTHPRVIDLNVECHNPENPRGHVTHDFSVENCLEKIPRGAEVYGLSIASMQMQHAKPIIKALSLRERAAMIIVGGAHVSAFPQDFDGLVNVAIRYEGEAAYVRFLEWYEEGRTNLKDAFGGFKSSMTGLHTMIVEGKQVNPLDDAPIPARELLDFSKYTRKIGGQPATNIITSRGCPARCIYCQQEDLWGKGLRLQTPERILKEVDDIYDKTGIRNLLFLDDSLTACSRHRMSALCAGLKARGVQWRGWTRANLISRPEHLDMLREMHDAGFVSCCVGVEAGTNKLLKTIAKQTTVAQNYAALANLKAAGIKARCSIMVGLPGETWEDVQALVEFVAKAQPDDWILSSLVPLPGTPSYDNAAEFGIEIDFKKVKDNDYKDVFIVGGNEKSGMFHQYKDVDYQEIQQRHDYVQEMLLRLCPRDRQGVVA